MRQQNIIPLRCLSQYGIHRFLRHWAIVAGILVVIIQLVPQSRQVDSVAVFRRKLHRFIIQYLYSGCCQRSTVAFPVGGGQSFLMVPTDIVDRIFLRQCTAQRQCHTKVLIITAHHIAGHYNDIRFLRTNRFQQSTVLFSQGHTVQIRKLYDVIAIKAFRQTHTANGISYCF